MPRVLLAVLTVYAVMSVVTFGVYALDKRAAARGSRRTPEKVLHLLELLGGCPGAFLAQRLVRHKNRKPAYQLVFWSIVALHAAAWGLAAWLWLRAGS